MWPLLQLPRRADIERLAGLDAFQRFLFALSASVIVASLLLATAITYVLRSNFVAEEGRVTAEAVRVLTNVDLDPEAFARAASGAPEIFRHAVTHLSSIPDFLRIKIYDANGAIVWSDEPRAIGRRFPDNHELAEALEGEIEVEMGLLKAEHVFEASQVPEQRLLEIYVPLLDARTGRTYGVFEVYKHPVGFFSALDRAHLLVWGICGSVGLVLFLSLAGIFLSARRTEKRLAARARETEAQLLHAEKLAGIGGMVAAIAHEINNPLGILVTKVGLLRREANERDCAVACAEDLIVIDRELGRISATLRGLLTFARRTEARLVPTDLNTVLRDTLQLVETPFAKGGIRIETDLAAPLPSIRGDASQLQQVVLNLLQNARAAMPGGGTITMRTAECCGLVTVEVQDTGHGIAREDLPHIFEPFFSTKPTGDGTGLGLSVTYGIVRNHGGDIQVRSEPGAGACFRLAFPGLT